MLVSDYNYDLPEERIAKFPPEKRGSTRLLVLDRKTGKITDSYYRDLADFLNPGDVLILPVPSAIVSHVPSHCPLSAGIWRRFAQILPFSPLRRSRCTCCAPGSRLRMRLLSFFLSECPNTCLSCYE